MREIIPLEQMLDQLTQLYNQILSNQNKKLLISQEMVQEIHRLARDIRAISQITEEEAARRGLSQNFIRQTVLGPKNELPPDIQNLLERAQYLKSQLEGCKNTLKDIIKKQKEEKRGKHGAAKKRKDKFKNIGAKNGWIPL